MYHNRTISLVLLAVFLVGMIAGFATAQTPSPPPGAPGAPGAPRDSKARLGLQAHPVPAGHLALREHQ